MRRRGFTLLEVMVALALLAASLMALSDLTGNALRNHVYARDLSAATLLARGKMAELTQKYEDQGFKDFDEEEHGDFADEGRADVRWRLQLVRPDAELSADQLMAMLSGAGGDPQQLISAVMGGAGLAGAAGSSTSGAQGGTTTTNPMAGVMAGILQSRLTAFGEAIKRSFREMRLSVAWRDGAQDRGFTVVTHLLVINPMAPGGARGDNPEVPPNIAALPSALTTTPQPKAKPGSGQ